LKNWSAVEASKKISVPTLVTNGTNEGATNESIKPFLDNIKGVKYVKFLKSTHMALYEEKELFLKTVGEWLLEK
jgi:pimeloyl-ACP methyl ester carboxylesterase